jgi:hypothetical protein
MWHAPSRMLVCHPAHFASATPPAAPLTGGGAAAMRCGCGQATVATQPQMDQHHQRIVGSTRKDYQTYTFSVGKPGGRQYYICCDSKQEMEDWMESIKTVVCTIRPRPAPPPKRRMRDFFWPLGRGDSDAASPKSPGAAGGAGAGAGHGPHGDPSAGGFKSLLSRRKSMSLMGRVGAAAGHVVWGQTALLALHGPEGMDRWSKLSGGSSLWVCALEGLVATDAKALPLFALRQLHRPASADIALAYGTPGAHPHPGRPAPAPVSFKAALNDPMLLVAFAVFLDRAFANGRPLLPASGGGASPVTSAHLMFWLHCDRVLQVVAASDDVSSALFAARTELAALLQLYTCHHPRVETCALWDGVTGW